MKRFGFIIVAVLLALNLARHWGEEPQMLVDASVTKAQADRWCDFPKQRVPLPKHRLNPMVGGLDKPNGDTA